MWVMLGTAVAIVAVATETDVRQMATLNFPITAFGALPGGTHPNTGAMARAVAAASRAVATGGADEADVVVPAGRVRAYMRC